MSAFQVLIRAARSQHVADFTCTDMSETSLVERLPTMLETRVQSLSQEDLLEKEMATHSSNLVWVHTLRNYAHQTDDWLKMWYICKMEFYLAIKK